MTQNEFYRAISESADIPMTKVKAAFDAATTIMARELVDGRDDKISTPLGTFRSKSSAARQARNPATGGTVDVPAKTSVAFKPSTALVRRHG